MTDLYTIAKRLNVDNRILKLLNNEVLIPDYIDDLNPTHKYWYPHPPCLIPLFLGYGASYTGIVKHFFCQRQPTFAEYFLEEGYLSEIARNADQFITLLVLRMIMTKDGLTEEIINFSKELGFDQYAAVDDFTLSYGDDPANFDHLVFFDHNKPFKYVKETGDYNGDFPSSLYALNKKTDLQNSSYVEFAAVEDLVESEGLPPWLIAGNDRKELFGFYLSQNNLKDAWLTLNSKNWLLEDLAAALKQLSKKADDGLFSLVADHWIDGWQKSSFLASSY